MTVANFATKAQKHKIPLKINQLIFRVLWDLVFWCFCGILIFLTFWSGLKAIL